MKFTVLSHAGLQVEHNGCSVVIDPWMVGSCYWRSWWNFPEVSIDPASLKPTYIYLTHIHWDHFHGPSLRKFSRETPMLIPKDRYNRMKRDLHSIGFRNVTEIPDSSAYRLSEDFCLTPYLFGVFTDSAVVVSSRRVTLLNANDCKIIGLPLKRLLKDHPKIDFVFRSHSSANARLSHEYLDAPNEKLDDRERYMRSFCNFMKAAQPAYAVPFASNHCHLHKETFRFNDWIVSPI
ncbi:MAG TPA: MBL fold metallo-hydrolase, partial [Nitrospiria bacterium]|nr:MBL fold metallo-hydrolase [Nitrospiria bacterium]